MKKQKKPRIPSLVRRKDGRSVVVLRQPDGKRRTVYLGENDSAKALRNYNEAIAEWLRSGRTRLPSESGRAASAWPTIKQLAAEFLIHADGYYRDETGTRSREVVNFELALKPLLAQYRDLATDRISTPDLESLRDQFGREEVKMKRDVNGTPVPGTGKRRSRNYVNSVFRRIKHVFRWGVRRQLVPPTTWHEISAMQAVPRNRGGMRESTPVAPIGREAVDATIAHLPAPLKAAVELQWNSGMRPSEVLQMRMADLDRSGPVWTYKPQQHKTAYRGRERTVKLGERCQEILRPLLRPSPEAHLIQPADSRPTVKTGDCYRIDAYRKAIHRACDRANIPRWSPNRLRHAAGTRITAECGTELARALLGHADDRMTRHYAKSADDLLAEQAARKIG